MKGRSAIFTIVITAIIMFAGPVMAADTVSFEPVRAPSLGPGSAPVTVIEIADYM